MFIVTGGLKRITESAEHLHRNLLTSTEMMMANRRWKIVKAAQLPKLNPYSLDTRKERVAKSNQMMFSHSAALTIDNKVYLFGNLIEHSP